MGSIHNAATPPILAVSFDLDGTLYGTGPHRMRLMPRLLPQLALIKAWSGAVKGSRGERHPQLDNLIVERTATRLGVEPYEAQARLWFFLDRCWIPGLRPAHVLPGIHDALTLLDARNIPRGVASDHPVQAKLRSLGLSDGWRAMVDGEGVGALKPWPDVLMAACAAMGCQPANLLHVGDRHDTDGEAARAAGASYLHVLDESGSTASLATRIAALLDSRSATAQETS